MSKSDFWAQSPKCEHVWSVVTLPMNLEAAARAMIAAFCPACGNDSPTVAPAAAIPKKQQDFNMSQTIRADGKFIINKADPARPRRHHETIELAEAEARRLQGGSPADTFIIAREVAKVVPNGC